MRQIIAMGGGGFSMEPENLLLDTYILNQSPKEQPSVCFVPTASGDQELYIKRFYLPFTELKCLPSHLSLFEPNFTDLERYILEKDIIYVGGGNTRNMLVFWKEWGVDDILKKAYQNGTVLAGLSAGSICWFEEGLTNPLNGPLYKINGLGFLHGSHCPHYDGEEKRRFSYQRMLTTIEISAGYAVDDGAALHFIDEKVSKTISSRPEAKAYYLINENGRVVEEAMDAFYLGNSL